MSAEPMALTISELERRLLNIIRIGTIASVDLAAETVRVKLNETHTTGDLPWQTQRAGNVRTWSPPSVGEQVMLFSPAGDLTQAVVCPSLFQSAHPAPSHSGDEHVTDYGDGTVISYDTKQHKLRIDVAGAVELICPAIDLGNTGGARVARMGDHVNVGSGSSAGLWPIVEGSDLVRAA